MIVYPWINDDVIDYVEINNLVNPPNLDSTVQCGDKLL